MSARGAAIALGAFARTRWLVQRLQTPRDLERYQRQRVGHWLHHHATAVPAFRGLADRIARDGIAALPVIDKAALLARFADHNRLGLDAAEARDMADGGWAPPGHAVGTSTGTTGPRAPYLVSHRERYVWLGTLLAKALPDAWRRRHRVAVVLPRGSALYDAANASGALSLLFVPLGDGLDAARGALERFRPSVIVAPPHALRWLAERGAALAPERLFSAAEVLDPLDRAVIERAFPGTGGLRELYMATEGLFAVSCPLGTLHLAEDRVLFELEPAGAGLVSPIVTDFTRRAQIMARYRMNDLLRPAPPCPCGSPLRAIEAVEGRADDAFMLPGAGGTVTIPPGVLRDSAVSVAGVDDFRLAQTGPDEVMLRVPPGANAKEAAAAVGAAIRRAGAEARVVVAAGPLPPPETKLRRVERRWHPDQARAPSSASRNRSTGR